VDGHFPFRRAFRILLLASLPSTFPQAFKETVIHILPKSADFVGHFFGMLDGLAILDDFETVIAGVLKDEIEAKVMEVCPMQWTEPQLPGLRRWFQETVVPWLSAVYARASGQVSGKCFSDAFDVSTPF
jgi:anaphase-promoting complex subunit 2